MTAHAPRAPRFLRLAAIAAIASLALLAATAAQAQLWDARDRFMPIPVLPDPEFLEFGHALASCDWDGDGRSDLAVGMPEYNDEAGAVFVYQMGPLGPVPAGNFTATSGEELGRVLACGDFDGDGDDELVAGAAQYEANGIQEGRVLFYGWAGAMIYLGELRQSLAGVTGAAEDGDEFGGALATGDFDCDGADDLAVGSPGEDVGAVNAAGAVTIFYGQPGIGLGIPGNTIWHKDTAGVVGDPAADENLGAALTAFDSNCDAFDDLAVGVPGETVAGVGAAGTVYFVNGSASGIVDATSVVLDTTSFTQAGASPPFPGDRFGSTLASAGNYFGGPCGALAIGAPLRDVLGAVSAGALYLLRGSIAVSRYFTASDFGGSPEDGDHFAATLAFADFDADGRMDVAVGTPREELVLSNYTGAVYVALSAGTEPDAANAQFIFPRSTLDLSGTVTNRGDFGLSLAAGDFDGNGQSDLAVGLPKGDYGNLSNVGGVELLFSALFSADFEGDNDNEWSSSVP